MMYPLQSKSKTLHISFYGYDISKDIRVADMYIHKR